MQAFASAFEDSHRTPPGSRVTGFLSGKQSRGKKRLSLFRKRTGSVLAPTRFVFLLDRRSLVFPSNLFNINVNFF